MHKNNIHIIMSFIGNMKDVLMYLELLKRLEYGLESENNPYNKKYIKDTFELENK